jgi:hypothetical protein
MPTVRFAWNSTLVDVRRSVCPNARWNAKERTWTMTEQEAEAFLAASHARLRCAHTEITIDGVRWTIGAVRGAPCKTEEILASVGPPTVQDLIAARNVRRWRAPFG